MGLHPQAVGRPLVDRMIVDGCSREDTALTGDGGGLYSTFQTLLSTAIPGGALGPIVRG
jgi:hypothetical protein